MADLLIYGATGAFALLFSFFVHHAHSTRQLIERMRIEERADMEKLNKLMEEVREQVVPRTNPGLATAMCLGCGAQTAAPNSAYCTDCHGRLPQLKRKAEPTSSGVGGPTTPTGFRT